MGVHLAIRPLRRQPYGLVRLVRAIRHGLRSARLIVFPPIRLVANVCVNGGRDLIGFHRINAVSASRHRATRACNVLGGMDVSF